MLVTPHDSLVAQSGLDLAKQILVIRMAEGGIVLRDIGLVEGSRSKTDGYAFEAPGGVQPWKPMPCFPFAAAIDSPSGVAGGAGPRFFSSCSIHRRPTRRRTIRQSDAALGLRDPGDSARSRSARDRKAFRSSLVSFALYSRVIFLRKLSTTSLNFLATWNRSVTARLWGNLRSARRRISRPHVDPMGADLLALFLREPIQAFQRRRLTLPRSTAKICGRVGSLRSVINVT